MSSSDLSRAQQQYIQQFPHMLDAVLLGGWAALRADNWESNQERPAARSILSALRCVHLVENEGTCQTKQRKCSLLGKTTLLECMVCQKHVEKPELTEDEKLLANLL